MQREALVCAPAHMTPAGVTTRRAFELLVANFKNERRGVAHLKSSGKGGKTRYVPLHPAASGLVAPCIVGNAFLLAAELPRARRAAVAVFVGVLPNRGLSGALWAHDRPDTMPKSRPLPPTVEGRDCEFAA